MTATMIRAAEAFRERRDERVRVLIADHDGLARRMMQTLLQEADGVMTVPAARNAREVLQHACYYRPTVLILDTALLPPGGCVELIRKLLALAPQIRILTVSAEENDHALAALRAGAVGHISKDVQAADLARLVTLAADGEAIIPQRLMMPLLGLLRAIPDAGWRPIHSRLTTREWEIVELLGHDTSTESVAQRLMVSPTTVYSHVKSVLRKLNVHSRPDAVEAAKRLRHEEVLGINTPTRFE